MRLILCFTSSCCGSWLAKVTFARGVKDCRLHCEQGRVDPEAVNCNDDDENLYIHENRIIQKSHKLGFVFERAARKC